ncbi:MAG: glutamate 5-kinase [Desulfobulbaceae bacterium]|nr:glutamate 5-kinase [Desulfobulbaceae bacterium]
MNSKIEFEDGLYYRQTLFDKAKRVVVKVGSAILTGENGLDKKVLDNLAKEISFLHKSGREVILVTSGAVSAGRRKIHISDDVELTIKQKQALAAVGQSSLMHDYDEAFSGYGENIAQILLTHSDLANRKRYLNVRNTILTLFKYGVIPVINENDTVSTEELKFSDNDNLGALVANLIEADMFICLTDVDALYDKNPLTDPLAKAIYTVAEVTDEIEAMAGNSKSVLGTGGMSSKIHAAKMVSAGGGSSFIGPGRQTDILQHLFSGEIIGTFFLPRKEKMQSRKRWIAYVLKPKGKLMLDPGACNAITKNGKSLLPSGIIEIDGQFGVGDPVRCVDTHNTPVAVGLTNFRSDDLRKIKGMRSDRIVEILGTKESDEVMHRDNLVIL